MSDIAEHQLDTCGLYCPEPVMMLHNKMHDVAVGELLKVVATDPSTKRDIPKFCNFLGHELVSHHEEKGSKGANYIYLIRKA